MGDGLPRRMYIRYGVFGKPEPIHDRMNDLVYGRNWLDSNGILEEVNRLLAGCDGPERWNPYRDAANVVS